MRRDDSILEGHVRAALRSAVLMRKRGNFPAFENSLQRAILLSTGSGVATAAVGTYMTMLPKTTSPIPYGQPSVDRLIVLHGDLAQAEQRAREGNRLWMEHYLLRAKGMCRVMGRSLPHRVEGRIHDLYEQSPPEARRRNDELNAGYDGSSSIEYRLGRSMPKSPVLLIQNSPERQGAPHP